MLSPRRAPTLALLPLVLLPLVLLAACKSGPLGGKSEEGIPETQLRAQLGEWAQAVSAEVQNASGAIGLSDPGREVVVRTLHWRLRSVTTARVIAAKADTREALLDAWCYSVQMKQFFGQGEGKELFGAQTALALAACENVERDVADVARAVLAKNDVEKVSAAIERYSREHPLRGLFAREPFTLANSPQSTGFPLQGMITAPFSILKPFDETARAVQDFNIVAAGISGIVAELPNVLRWNAELLVYDLEQRETTVELRRSIERTSEAVERVALKADSWNADLEATGTALMRKLEKQQEPLQETLAEARATSESVERSIGQVEGIVRSLDGTLAAFRDAGAAWGETARAFGIQPASETPPEPPPEPAEPGPSVAEQLELVRASVEGLATTAGELRAAVLEVRGLISSGELERASGDVEGLVRASVDHLVLRAALLLGLAALLALGLVWFAARVRRRPSGG